MMGLVSLQAETRELTVCLWHSDLGFPASRTMRRDISVFGLEAPQSVGLS